MSERRFIRLPEVKKLTGLSRSTIYVRIANGDFPRPIQLGGRVVAWLDSDISAWIAKLISNNSRTP